MRCRAFSPEDLDVEFGARIVRLERSRRGWTLLDDRGSAHADFAAVVLALPAPAAAALAGSRNAARGAGEIRADGALLGDARRLRRAASRRAGRGFHA